MVEKKQPVAKKDAAKDGTPKAKKNIKFKRFVDGNGGELRYMAVEKDGAGLFYVIHTVRVDGKRDKSKSRGRGATQKFATYADAVKALEANLQVAVKRGWTMVERKQGRVDTFDLTSLPTPTAKQ